MPFKEIPFRRWEAVGILLALTASFVIGLAALTRQTNAAQKEAEHATRLAIEQQHQSATIKRNRDEQIRDIHSVQVEGCHRFHRLDMVVRDLLVRSAVQVERSNIPDLTPAQKTRLDQINADTLANLRQAIQETKAADCRGVPPLPVVGSPS